VLFGGQATYTGVPELFLTRQNADGSPDTTFGTAGAAHSALGTKSGVTALALMPPDANNAQQIVTMGTATIGGVLNAAIVRYDANGKVVTGGASHWAIGGGGANGVNDGTVDANGRVLVVGQAGGTYSQGFMLRLSGNALDSTFGTKGVVRMITPN